MSVRDSVRTSQQRLTNKDLDDLCWESGVIFDSAEKPPMTFSLASAVFG